MDIKVFRTPSSNDYKYQKVERVKDDGQKKKKDDQQQKQKKKDEKIEGIFASLAESLGQNDDGY
jgi:hypothetical protein